jgi:hypothetical protein
MCPSRRWTGRVRRPNPPEWNIRARSGPQIETFGARKRLCKRVGQWQEVAVATKLDLYHWQRDLARRPREATRLVVLLKDFSPAERGRLRFTRWLVATGRLAG